MIYITLFQSYVYVSSCVYVFCQIWIPNGYDYDHNYWN